MWFLRKVLQPLESLGHRSASQGCARWVIELVDLILLRLLWLGQDQTLLLLMDIAYLDITSTKMLRRVFADVTQHSDGPRRSPKTILVCALYFFALLTECTFSSGRFGSAPGES